MAVSDYATAAYSATGEMPFRIHVEAHSLMALLGDVTGKSALDVACGHGFYSRLLVQGGATQVVGVDASESMIRLAREIEQKDPLGIEYRVLDVFTGEPQGVFDVVTAGWAFPYAASVADVETLARNLYAQVARGGRLAAVVPHPSMDLVTNYTKYAMTFRSKRPLAANESLGDGDEYSVEFDLDPPVSVHARVWTPATIDRALFGAGFHDVHWAVPQCSPEGLALYPPDHWSQMVEKPNMLFFRCDK